MRTVPAAHTAARQATTSRFCKVWEVTRLDGTVYRLTEHDRDLVVDGDTFYATASFDPSTIKGAADMSVSDMDVLGAFDTELITAHDLIGGLLHGAAFWVGEVLWDAPEEGVDIHQFGWLGRVRETGGKFAAELHGLTQRLQQTIGEVYQPTCRATLGDSRCGVDLAPWTISSEVSSVTSRREFAVTGLGLPDTDTWFQGMLTWTSGENDGLSMDVKTSDGFSVTLFLPMPFEVAEGDTFTITAGCNKTLDTCRDKFANVLNFRAEPHVPVSDDLVRGPGPDTSRDTGGSSEPVEPPAPAVDPEVPTIYGTPEISDS